MAALTANFEADFSKFYDAVQQAVVELDGFEKGAARAGQSLDSMASRFSGEQVIKNATLMAEAIERLGGVSTLTEAELARVGKTANEAVAKMTALGVDVPKNLQDLADASRGAGEQTESLSVSVADLAASYITAEVAIKLVEGAYHLLVDSMAAVIASAADAEQADSALLAALTAQGTAVPSVVKAYDDYARALQATTRYSDDAVKAAERILAQIGNVMPRDMQRATKAAADLATVLNIDLSSAATMVAKAAEGQTTALKKAGIVIDESATKSGDFGKVLTQLEARIAGAADAAGNTFSGQLDKLANAWDNVLEATGRVITNNATARELFAGLTKIIDGNTTELNDNAKANDFVSDAVLLVAHGLVLAVDGLDILQHSLQATRVLLDSFAGAALFVYEGLQKIEIATQTPLEWAGSEEAAQRVREAGEAMQWASDKLDALNGDINASRATSAAWHDSMEGLKAQLVALEAQLEATRGKTAGLAATQAESTGVWDKQTGAISAQEMALQEHALATSKAGDSWQGAAFKIDAAATAIAKGIDAAVMAANKASQAVNGMYTDQEQKMLENDKASKAHYEKIAADAGVAYYTALDHQEQYTQETLNRLFQASQDADQAAIDWADRSNAAMAEMKKGVDGVDGAVKGLTDTFSVAGDAFDAMGQSAYKTAQMMLSQDWINYAYTSPGSVARGTLGQTFMLDPSTGELQHRAAGGPVAAGQSYMVGEKGPELFVPGSSGAIVPHGAGAGGGATVNIAPGAFVLNYPIVNNPQALDQLARTVGDAIVSKLTRAGTRL
jgi:hypothetical protein